MNLKEIEKLIEIFSEKKMTKFSLKNGDFELCLENVSHGAVGAVVQPSVPQVLSQPLQSSAKEEVKVAQEAPLSGDFIESPMVGTFYRCPSPNAPAYANVGDKVKKGQVIGIVEAMKIMNEIEAEFDCKIVEIIASDAQPVEFGSKLIKVEKI